MWSRDWPRPKLKEIWSFKLQDFNVLENTCFIFQNFNFTGAYVVLNGDSKNVLFFCHYFQKSVAVLSFEGQSIKSFEKVCM